MHHLVDLLLSAFCCRFAASSSSCCACPYDAMGIWTRAWSFLFFIFYFSLKSEQQSSSYTYIYAIRPLQMLFFSFCVYISVLFFFSVCPFVWGPAWSCFAWDLGNFEFFLICDGLILKLGITYMHVYIYICFNDLVLAM